MNELPPHTADEPVDQALGSLSDLDSQSLAEQVQSYIGAHRALQERLASLEE